MENRSSSWAGTHAEWVKTARAGVAEWRALFRDNNLLTYASAIAFQLLIATAAIAYLGVALLHPLGQTGAWRDHLAPAIRRDVPASWYEALNGSVHKEMRSGSALALVFGVALAVWEVSGALRAMMGALNRIYRARETRSIGRRFAVSIGLAVPIIVLVFAALGVWFAGVGASFGGAVVVLRLAIAAVLCWCVIALIVFVAPAKRQPWQWVSAGSVWIIVAWLAVSILYAIWIGHVVNLRRVEGALAVVVLTTGYLYASSLAFLIGAQLDQLIRQGDLVPDPDVS